MPRKKLFTVFLILFALLTLTAAAAEGAPTGRAIEFVNRYNPKTGLQFSGAVSIDLRALTEKDVFTFALFKGDEQIATAQNDATGRFAFPTIVYELANDVGTHNY